MREDARKQRFWYWRRGKSDNDFLPIFLFLLYSNCVFFLNWLIQKDTFRTKRVRHQHSEIFVVQQYILLSQNGLHASHSMKSCNSSKKKMKSVSLEKACAIIGISLVIVFEFSLIENIETEFNTDFRFFKKPKKKTSNMLRLVRVEHVGKRDRERKCGSKVILYLKVVHKKRKHGMWLFRWYFWMHSLSRQLFIYN